MSKKILSMALCAFLLAGLAACTTPNSSSEPVSEEPTSSEVSETPSTSEQPSETPSVSEQPSETPSVSEEPSEAPSTSEEPSEAPSTSEEPSENPSTSEEPSSSESSEPESSEPESSEPESSEPESSEPESSEPESSEPESSEPTPESYTFYYYNNLGWDSVYVHSWVDGGAGTTWPGVAATAVEGEQDWYCISFTAEEIVDLKFIFNNKGLGQQTGNITVDVTKPYHYGKSALSYESKEAVAAAIANPVTYTWYLRGDVNGWAESELFGLELNGASTTEYVIANVDLTAGTKFKISDGSSWLGYDNVKGSDQECKALLNAPDNDRNIVIKETGNYTIYFETATGDNYGLWISKN